MALADIDISKPKAEDAPRRHHPAAPWMPVLTVLLLGLAVAANLGALLTTAWLKTTAYPTLFNAEGMIVTGVNGTVTTRVSAMEICFSITNVTKPIRAHDYCLSLTTTSSSQSACQVVQSKKALAATNVDWDSDMAEFLRLACGGVGDATVVLQLGAVAVAGFAILTVTLTCCVRGRIGRTLRIIATAACVFSGLLAISAYMLWLTKLSTGDMHHGKSAVLTAGSLFLFGGAALAASSGLETFRTPPPHALNDGEPMGEEEIEAKAEAPRPLPVAA